MSSVLSYLVRSIGKKVQKITLHDTQIRNRSIKAAVLTEYKHPLVVEEVKAPKVKADQVNPLPYVFQVF